jgi:hypothetical protein
MTLVEQSDSWTIECVEGSIGQIHIDFRVTFDVVDGADRARVTIEELFRFNGPDGEVPISPAETPSLGPILALFNAEVTRITIKKSGRLRVEGNGGWSLEVDPNDTYEAWQLGYAPIHSLFVCSPGGEVSLFQEETPANP